MTNHWLATLGMVVGVAVTWDPLGSLSPVQEAETTARPDLNARVLAFCREALGTSVGDGECYALADHALRAAGAKRAIHYPQEPNRGDYVWGERVVAWSIAPNGKRTRQGHPRDVRPGDIVQFRDAVFERRGARSISFRSADHHTAVVERITGETLTVLHQNSNGRRDVTRETYRLSDLKPGLGAGRSSPSRRRQRPVRLASFAASGPPARAIRPGVSTRTLSQEEAAFFFVPPPTRFKPPPCLRRPASC